MRREDIIDLIKRIPESDHPKLQFVLRSSMAVTVDTLIHFDEHYMALRGRESGQTEDGRAFFIPYDEVLCMKIERIVLVNEINALYPEHQPFVAANRVKDDSSESDEPNPAVTPAPETPLDPNAIARQNLLDRIRAARSLAGSAKPTTAGK